MKQAKAAPLAAATGSASLKTITGACAGGVDVDKRSSCWQKLMAHLPSQFSCVRSKVGTNNAAQLTANRSTRLCPVSADTTMRHLCKARTVTSTFRMSGLETISLPIVFP